MELDYFPCRYSYAKKLAMLSDQEVGRLFRALLQYGERGEETQLAGREAVAFEFIAYDIDEAKREYAEKCETNRKNSRQRPISTDNDRYRPITTDNDRSEEKREKERKERTKEKAEKDKRDTLSIARARGFDPPSVEEVALYCTSRRNGVDPASFVDFYTAKNWMVGKNKMVDWKAAVRTWEKRDGRGADQKPGSSFETDDFFAAAVQKARGDNG